MAIDTVTAWSLLCKIGRGEEKPGGGKKKLKITPRSKGGAGQLS